MADSDAYYASQASYGSAKHHDELIKRGYQRDDSLSSKRASVYYNPDRAIIAFKGTTPTDLEDLDADYAIAIGNQANHYAFKDAEKLYEKATKKYKNIGLTGHSLGGAKAIHLHKKHNNQTTVFNPGTGILGLDVGKSTVYKSDNDFISDRIKGGNVVKKGNSHSLNSFAHEFEQKATPNSKRSLGKYSSYLI